VRLPTALPYITELRSLAHQGVPVFLTGDFNSPSNLDWTQSTVNKLRNHRYDVPWPVTKTLENKGFIDSYRSYHPDPIQSPGYTWPSGRPALKKSFDNFNPTANDFPDRLDFIFTSGPTKVLDSEIVGESDPHTAKIQVTPWPSDHRAVISQFEVTPHVFPKKFLTPIKVQRNLDKPTITAPKLVFKTGEIIPIHWTHAPGNGYDYIRIVPTHNDPLHVYETTARLYTHGAINGSVQYSSKNVHGNWTAWFKSPESHWPLAPGNYDIQLILDDGMTVLASAAIQVKPLGI